MQQVIEFLRDYGNESDSEKRKLIQNELSRYIVFEDLGVDKELIRFLNRHFIPNQQPKGESDVN